MDFQTEKYIVLYGSDMRNKFNKATFEHEEDAIEYAKQKHDKGYDVTLQQLNNVTGWL